MSHRRWFALLLLVLPLAACESMPEELPVYMSDDNQVLPAQPADGLVAKPGSPIPDVPMPVGFVLVESKSRSSSVAGGGRSVEHYYQGRASKSDTLAFYRRSLGSYGWDVRREENNSGLISLQAIKGRETLDLRITNPRGVTTALIVIRGTTAGR